MACIDPLYPNVHYIRCPGSERTNEEARTETEGANEEKGVPGCLPDGKKHY